MNKVRIKLNSNGIKALLKSEEVKDYVEAQARSEAKSDTYIKSFIGYDRANVYIYPNTKEHKG